MIALLPSQNQVDPRRWQNTLDLLGVQETDLGPLDKKYPHRIIAAFCQRQQIPYLDLLDAFAATDKPEDLYLTFIDDLHFSPAGHRLAAAHIADFLGTQSTFLHNPALDSFRHGLAHVAAGNAQKAERYLRQAISQKDTWDAPYVALGKLYRSQGRWAEAQQTYRQALEVNPRAGETHAGLGEVLALLGNRTDAIDAYRHALALQPNWWPYYETVHDLYVQEDMSQEAAATKRQLDEFFAVPEGVKTFWWIEHLARGTHFANRVQWSAAEREFTRAMRFISSGPGAAETLYQLGLARQNLRRHQEALAAFKRAFELKPELLQAGVQAALLYEATGKLDNAVAILKKLVHLAPNHAAIHAHLKRVQQLAN